MLNDHPCLLVSLIVFQVSGILDAPRPEGGKHDIT